MARGLRLKGRREREFASTINFYEEI